MRAPAPATLWRTLVTDTAERADAGARLALEREGASRLDRDAAVVLLTGVLCLTFIQFFGRPGVLETWRQLCAVLHLEASFEQLQRWLSQGPESRIHARVMWTIARDGFMVAMPVAVVLGILRRPLGDFGVRVRGILPHGWIYLALLALIAPAVIIASFTEPFQATYPFYRLLPNEHLWPNLWLWELMYASQFVALEFFFRGFLIHGLKHRMGYAAVWVSLVPYTMIHFEKPFAECLGAIIAGWVLGTLSLRTGSMWWGAAIHTAVAWGMDLLSLTHQGRLG
ncbi:MAG TPA: CPBP family intramembrane glutamic endopeptidase [Myxococcaceae bacterium]|nr:CPBP family intramembrane glutamic endopeptidase [Myxococcaceae bacterium]